MKKHTSGQLPYGIPHQNVALAFSLYIAGCPFADDKHPLTHIYDAKVLADLGFTGPIEEATREAFAAGQRGIVEYGFARSITFGEAQKAFDTQQTAMVGSTLPARAMVRSIMESLSTGLLSLPEALSAATCVIIKRRKEELAEWETHRTYGIQRNRIEVRHYDARELAEQAFLSGEFYAFAAVIAEARKAFLALAFSYPPVIRLHRGGKASSSGENRTRFPGFVLYSENAENDTRKDLGVPTR